MAAIYIHVPFCKQRCSYCDFYFVTSRRHVSDYVDAVCREITIRASRVDSIGPVKTVYFGGGTPSRLSTEQLGSILDTVSLHFGLADVEEVTIEVNPEDPDAAYLDRLRALGFTRLSIGLQSLRGDDLVFMNRSHSAEQGTSFIDLAMSAGFLSVSMDLIFGLPQMTEAGWRDNLAYAVSSGVQHVSLYGLTIEPKTVLGKLVRTGKVQPAADTEMEAQFRAADEMMTGHGFEHYEISNFAKPGHRSRHNQCYWNHTNYLGFGPSAHSFLHIDDAKRWENVRSLRLYLEKLRSGELPISFEENLDEGRLMQEYVLLGLRTSAGISLETLRDEYGHALSEVGESLVSDLRSAGLLVPAGDRVILTLDGFLVADSVTSALLTRDAIMHSR